MLVSSRGGGAGERGGPSLLATLKVRVSRLEAALRDKDAELLRLQASTRATTINELRIQAHTYYQEVVRLRNQLNISQHATVPIIQSTVTNGVTSPLRGDSPTHTPHQNHPSAKSSNKIFHKRTQLSNNLAKMDANKEDDGDGGKKESAETMVEEEEDELRKSVMLLHDENNKLRDQVTTLINTMQNSEQGVSSSSRDAFERVLEKLEESRTEAGTAMLQCRMSELQGKETEWENERSSLRELITTLQDDRAFYKQTATKKESEMEALRSEVITLQQEMLLMRQMESRRGMPHSRGAPRPSPRTTRTAMSGSGSSSDSASTSNRQSRTQSTARTPAASSRHLPSAPTHRHRSTAPKASSEPRELPPRPAPTRKLMTTSATAGSEGDTSAAAASKRQQQLASSRRLAASSGSKAGPTTVARTPSSKAAATATKPANRSSRSATTTPSVGSGTRSASTVPSKTSSRTVYSSSSSHSSSANRSNTSSAASSKTNSQRATPLSSPTKVKSSISSESRISKVSTTGVRKESSSQAATVSKSSSRTAKTIPKSSSSSSQTSRQASKTSSAQSSPSKASLSSPSKIAIANKRAALQKRPGNEAASSSSTSSPAAFVAQPIAETITEEDSHVLVELLRPEPPSTSSGEQSSPSGSLEMLGRQRTVTLHWDSAAGGSTDDSWGATGPRPLGVGGEAVDLPVVVKDDVVVSSSPSSAESPVPVVEPPSPHRDTKIVESLGELKSLLCSHLHRQQQLNRLLEQEPQLLLQSPSQPQQSRAATQRRRAALRHRRSPDGAEGDPAILDSRLPQQLPSSPTKSLPSPTLSKIPSSPSTVPKFPAIKTAAAAKSPSKSSVGSCDVKTPPTLTKLASPKKSAKAVKSSENSSATSSPGLVRQGTFNLDQNEAFIDKSCQGDAGEGVPLGDDGWLIGEDEQEDDRQALTDTISAHLARVVQLRELRD